MSKRKICVVTGTRAEYGLFYPILKKIQGSILLDLQVVATTMHYAEEFGLTYQQIEKDGFTIDEKVDNLLASDSKSAMAKSTGMATVLLSSAFEKLSPDIVLLLGDRFETHAAATTAMLMNIPIAHIHGGEVTEGAVDDKIRHSITKMASLHFVSTSVYRKRVIQMGEDPNSVFCSGAPGLDNILGETLLEKKELEKRLNSTFEKTTALFTYHSETSSKDFDVSTQIKKILEVIKSSKINVLFTYANADDGGRVINRSIEEFVAKNPKKYSVYKSLGQLRYLSTMRYVDLLIGNTSSGIIEAASFRKPVVNIGHRQAGRLRGKNVIDCDLEGLAQAISTALSPEFFSHYKNENNIYGTGDAADKIVVELERFKFGEYKKFYDL